MRWITKEVRREEVKKGGLDKRERERELVFSNGEGEGLH